MRAMAAVSCLAAAFGPPALAQHSDDVPTYPGCDWEQAVLAAPPDTGFPDIAVRVQRCDDPDMQIRFDYSGEGVIAEIFPDGYRMERIQVLHDDTAQAEALMRLAAAANAPDGERERCELTPNEQGLWTYGPNAAFTEELNATNEPWEACGLFGTGSQVQFFDLIGPHTAVFVWAGQDLPLFDPWSIELASE